MKPLKLTLELSNKEFSILTTALYDFRNLISEDPEWKKANFDISPKECQRILNKMDLAEVKFLEREWRNKDKS